MQIQINFTKDLLAILKSAADRHQVNLGSVVDVWGMLYKWIEYNRRQVLPRPRKVIFSQEILANSLFNQTAEVVEKSHAGHDLSGYLNRSANTLEKADMLFIDWNIKHFHFDDYKSSEANIKRSADLIFFREYKDELFFIQIGTHNFSDIELVEIINRNWPDQISKLNGIHAGDKISSKEIHQLRKAGVQGMISLSDSTVLFPPGGGYSTAGTSINIHRETDLLRNVILNFEKDCRTEILKLAKRITPTPKIIKGFLSINESGNLIFKTIYGMNLEVTGPLVFSPN
jgi:hypothetical protein